jgi:exopolysaccharide production protein ExoQ
VIFGEAVLPTARAGILMSREDDHAASLSGRLPLWEDCLEFVHRRPIVGYGFNSFWTEPHIEELSALHGWQVTTAHSAYLEVLLNVGAIGLLFFAGAYFLAVHRGIRVYRQGKDVNYAFMAAVVCCLLLDGLLESIMIYGTFAGFVGVVCVALLCRQDNIRSLPLGVRDLDR